MKKQQLNLPRKYLSYSAKELWKKNKQEYRDTYYRNKPRTDTVYTIFGSEVHKKIEDGELLVQDHPKEQYTSEVKIEVEIGGVPVLGYIDLLDMNEYRLSDNKTGSYKPDGTPRWTDSDVAKLDQLPFYSLIVKEKFGKVHKRTGLIWLVTEFQRVGSGIGGTNRLALTGEQYVFWRNIAKWERDRQQEDIITCAREISEDYREYLTNELCLK